MPVPLRDREEDPAASLFHREPGGQLCSPGHSDRPHRTPSPPGRLLGGAFLWWILQRTHCITHRPPQKSAGPQCHHGRGTGPVRHFGQGPGGGAAAQTRPPPGRARAGHARVHPAVCPLHPRGAWLILQRGSVTAVYFKRCFRPKMFKRAISRLKGYRTLALQTHLVSRVYGAAAHAPDPPKADGGLAPRGRLAQMPGSAGSRSVSVPDSCAPSFLFLLSCVSTAALTSMSPFTQPVSDSQTLQPNRVQIWSDRVPTQGPAHLSGAVGIGEPHTAAQKQLVRLPRCAVT